MSDLLHSLGRNKSTADSYSETKIMSNYSQIFSDELVPDKPLKGFKKFFQRFITIMRPVTK